MENGEQRAVYSVEEEKSTYLDIQAEVGISKHWGGYAATDRLHMLCRVNHAQEVLEVGCGIGVGPAHLAKRHGCRVVAVDVSQKMLLWAQKRARRMSVADRITFWQADVRDLPFDDDCFDATMAESVLSFVEDKEVAIREMIRVTRPGGYVGLNESFWIEEAPAYALARSVYTSIAFITAAQWQTLWEATYLEERIIEPLEVAPGQEIRDRIGWLGWRSILPAWGRVLKLLLRNPSARDAIKEQLDMPAELASKVGYALFVGRKP